MLIIMSRCISRCVHFITLHLLHTPTLTDFRNNSGNDHHQPQQPLTGHSNAQLAFTSPNDRRAGGLPDANENMAKDEGVVVGPNTALRVAVNLDGLVVPGTVSGGMSCTPKFPARQLPDQNGLLPKVCYEILPLNRLGAGASVSATNTPYMDKKGPSSSSTAKPLLQVVSCNNTPQVRARRVGHGGGAGTGGEGHHHQHHHQHHAGSTGDHGSSTNSPAASAAAAASLIHNFHNSSSTTTATMLSPTRSEHQYDIPFGHLHEGRGRGRGDDGPRGQQVRRCRPSSSVSHVSDRNCVLPGKCQSRFFMFSLGRSQADSMETEDGPVVLYKAGADNHLHHHGQEQQQLLLLNGFGNSSKSSSSSNSKNLNKTFSNRTSSSGSSDTAAPGAASSAAGFTPQVPPPYPGHGQPQGSPQLWGGNSLLQPRLVDSRAMLLMDDVATRGQQHHQQQHHDFKKNSSWSGSEKSIDTSIYSAEGTI